MGIKDLTPFLKEYAPSSIKHLQLSNLKDVVNANLGNNSTLNRPMRAAIDTSLFLYKYKYKSGDNFIVDFLEQINRLKINDINPIYVFDGIPPVEKKDIIESRKERKNAYKQRILDIQDRLTQNATDLEKKLLNQELYKIKKKLISITGDDISRLQYFLNIMNIPYIKEDMEADLVCSRLCSMGIVDFVISEDMDHLTSGTKILLRDFNNKNNYISMYRMDTAISILEISKDKWIDLCILLGCDYLPRIHGLGFKTSFKFISSNKTLEYPELIEKIRDKKKYSIPDDYTEKFKKAKEIFRNTLPMTFKESDLDKYNILFDNQGEVVKDYLKKYTQLSDQKIKNRIKNIFNYSI